MVHLMRLLQQEEPKHLEAQDTETLADLEDLVIEEIRVEETAGMVVDILGLPIMFTLVQVVVHTVLDIHCVQIVLQV